MEKTSLVLGALTSLAAGVTGVMAYGALAPSAPTPASSPAAVATASPGSAPAAHHPLVRYRPCPKGSRVEDGVCVTRLVHTVVVPAPAARSQVARRASASGAAEPADVDGGDDTPGTDEESDDDDAAEDESGDDDGEDLGDDGEDGDLRALDG